MKTKINYITYDSWWDTDVTVIPQLSKEYNVNVFCLNPSKEKKYSRKEVPANVSLYQLDQKGRDRELSSIWMAVKFLFKIIGEDKGKECIYFFIPGKNPWFLLLALLFFPKGRTIISSHNYLEHGDKNDAGANLLNKIKRKYYKGFKFFHFFSKHQLELFKQDYPNKKAFSTEMPLKDFGSAVSSKRTDTKVRLLFFGLIRDYKRLDWLIKSVKSIDETNLKVIIAGNASESDKRKYSKMIGDDKTFETHFEFIRNEDIPRYFVDTDFLVLPYESATQSGPSLIAINYGIPIIASNIPTFESLVQNGKNGFLFKQNSQDSLAGILCKVSKLTNADLVIMKKYQTKFKDKYQQSNNVAKAFYGFISKL